MGIIKEPLKVKLFTGIIASSHGDLERALKGLEGKFGKIDAKSPAINFSFTDYYAPEMGKDLIRLWAGFEPLIEPSSLAQIKIYANELEEKYSVSGKRRLNVDPGYLTSAKVVLASTKDFSHRIYLSGGIYGEVTLMFKHKNFVPLEWTYPDYQSKAAVEFFLETRKIFQEQIRNIA